MPVKFENGINAANVVVVGNSTGSTIYKGQAVYISGGTGDVARVSLAKADTEATSSKTLGLAWADIPDGATNGLVIVEGYLDKIDTSGANAVGDPIWLSPTTAGDRVYGLTNKPYAPNHLVYLGVVARKNANNGRIYVKVQNGFELSELHTVDLITSSPTSNQVLSYDGTLWKNRTLSSLSNSTGISSLSYNGSSTASVAIDTNKVPTISTSTYTTTFTPSESTTVTLPTGATSTLARTDAGQTFTGTNTFSSTISGSINGNAATVTNGVYTTDTGTVTSTMIANDTIVNADINSAAAIADTKLATISTAGKVSNSATTATDANTNSAIVARDGSGNFSAGTITASLTGNATGIAAGSTQSGTAAGSTNKAVDIYSNPTTTQNTATATSLNLTVRGETMPRLTAQSNVALSTGAGYAMRVLCTSTSNNINYISAACQAAGTVSACFFGLFNDSSGAIGSNIANTGSVSVAAGIITGQFASAQSLTAGTYYWLAIGTTNTGNPSLKGASLVTGMVYGSNIKPYIAQAGTGWSSSGSTVTWPSSWTSTTFTSLPWMIIY